MSVTAGLSYTGPASCLRMMSDFFPLLRAARWRMACRSSNLGTMVRGNRHGCQEPPGSFVACVGLFEYFLPPPPFLGLAARTRGLGSLLTLGLKHEKANIYDSRSALVVTGRGPTKNTSCWLLLGILLTSLCSVVPWSGPWFLVSPFYWALEPPTILHYTILHYPIPYYSIPYHNIPY